MSKKQGIEVFIEKMSVIIDISDGDAIVSEVVDGFSTIQNNDLRIAEVICNPLDKARITDAFVKKGYPETESDSEIWGSKFITSPNVKPGKILLRSEDGSKYTFKQCQHP